jgi:activator of HSP90 ATPase
MSETIKQETTLPGPPEQVYAALTDPTRFSAVSGGAPADIDTKPGGAFSLFGGRITGRNVELEPNRRLVQAWRAENWEAGRYSIVRFELQPKGKETRLIFEQSGHPTDVQEHLSAGWSKMYWDPLKAYLS